MMMRMTIGIESAVYCLMSGKMGLEVEEGRQS